MELLERDSLLDELRRAAAAAANGEGRLVVLEGEAGVGKSSVLRTLCARPGADVRVLWGACDALATPRPLGPLADMATRGAEATASRLAAGAPIHDVYDAFLDDLRAPTIAVMEDLHWADEATLDLLRFVGRRVGGTRSLLLGSVRAEELASSHHPLRAVLGDLATTGLLRRRIDPLSTDAVRRLAAGHEVDSLELHRVTGGNPFYVTEVLAAPAAAVPMTVRDAVLTRAGRLPTRARELLELASVEPGGVDRPLLRTLGVDDRALDEAVGAAVLVDDGRVLRFRHELARRAVESSMPGDRSRQLHRRLLEALSADPGVEPARLAHHAAAANDAPSSLRWSRAAGDAAMRAGAQREAAAHYTDAVAHADLLPVVEAAALFASQAEALHALDQAGRAVTAWKRVAELQDSTGDEVGSWWAQAQLARATWTAGGSREGYEVIRKAIAALDPIAEERADGRIAEAFAIAAYLAMLARDSDDAVTWARRAIELAETASSRSALPVAYNALGAARICGFEDVGGLGDLVRSAEIAQEVGAWRSVAGRYSVAGSALGEIRRYDGAISELESGIAYADAHDMDFSRRYCVAWLARIRFEQGRWAEADELVSQALGDIESSPISPMVALLARGRSRARRGLPDALGPLDQAWAIAQRTGDLQRTWPAIAGLAEAAWLEEWPTDERERVVDSLRDVLDDARRRRLPWAIGELAFWLDRLGHRPVDAAGAAPPYAESLAGNHAAAAERWTAIGCPYEAAWALADLDTEESLRSALTTLMSLGADPLATRVRRRLREMGAVRIPTGPRASTARSPSGLTAREAEVLDLLVAGLTDREIANRLVISNRTASHHVASILAKLGARRRSELIASVRADGSAAKDG